MTAANLTAARVAGPWTRFMDMHSGGGQKLEWPHIYIQAPKVEAELVFQHRFGRNPNRVTCTCCGEDYSIDEAKDLHQVTAFERGCDYAHFNAEGVEVPEDAAWKRGKGMVRGCSGRYVERPSTGLWVREFLPLEEYVGSGVERFIFADEIKPDERRGVLHEEGYVWQD